MSDRGERVVPGARPPATVVVCTHDRAAFLAACLDSVAAAMGPQDELIVVSTAPVKWAGAARHLVCDRPGKSRQLNRGLAAATHEVVLITDDDCRVSPGWISGLAGVFANPRVGVAFGPVRGLSQVPGDDAPRIPPGPAPVEYWVYAHGASMAVRRSAVIAAGGFDERLGPGALAHGEEGDLVLRLSEAGWACQVADASPVEHLDWRSPAETADNLLVYERGSGALLGAALRRSFRRSLKVFLLRLHYQGQLWSRPGLRGWWFGPRTLLAFGRGVVTGLRLEPTRWL